MARHKGPDHGIRILELLHDYGPQTVAQIAEQMPVTRGVVQKRMELLSAEGSVTAQRVKGQNYWTLTKDMEVEDAG